MSSFAFILLCIYLFSVVKIGNSYGPKTIEWKQDLICPKKQAVKHIKYNVTSTVEKNWYFACGNHTAVRLDDNCDENDSADKKQHDMNERNTRRTVYYIDPRKDDTCDGIYRNASQTQTFDNGTFSKSECVWRQKCVVNQQHQEIVRGSRISNPDMLSAVEYYCCISHCLFDCKDVSVENFHDEHWHLEEDQVIIEATQISEESDVAMIRICRDCDRFIVLGLIISGPCSYARTPHTIIEMMFDYDTYDYIIPPKGPLRNNQIISFVCAENFAAIISPESTSSRVIKCLDFEKSDPYKDRLRCVPDL